jgi:hypothetical protein
MKIDKLSRWSKKILRNIYKSGLVVLGNTGDAQPPCGVFINSTDFVNICCNAMLGRESSKEEKSNWVSALDSRAISGEIVLLELLYSREFLDRQQPNREFVPAGHYYSAVPSLKERTEFLNQEYTTEQMAGIDVNEMGQVELLKQISSYINEFCFPENKSDAFRYYSNNPFFSLVDSIFLFGIMRHFQPKRMIEIGSGFSSCLMMDTNDRFGGGIQFTFIEPYPDILKSLLKPDDVFRKEIVPQKLQNVDLGIFSALTSNDILFIDSTHVSKLGSDVNRELFHILPILQKGVLVHFHDIHWPFENLRQWIEQGRAWNESYILRAFLQYNDTFEIMLFPSYLQHCKREPLTTAIPRATESTAGSLWLRKVK